MVSYVGENYPTSYEQVGRYVSSEKLNFTPIIQVYRYISDVLYQQFAQLVFPI